MLLELEEDTFAMPLDVNLNIYLFQVIVETMIGFLLSIFGTVLYYTGRLKNISASSQFINK